MKTNRQSVYYIFEDAVRNRANDVAIWSRQGEYTWRDLSLRANQYATFFLALGVRPGDLVAFYLQNSPEFFCAWLGLWAIGTMTRFQDLSWSLNLCHRMCAGNDQLESQRGRFGPLLEDIQGQSVVVGR